MGTRPRITADEKLDALLSQFAQFKEQVAQIPTFTDWMSRMESHVSTALRGFAADSQRWNSISAPSLHACARSKHMQPQPQMYPAWQDPGPHSNKLMALQPQGPMAQGQLTTTGTQDVDLIPSPAQRMNMHEVLFCFDFHVNNITQECPLGSKSSGQRPKHQLSTSLRKTGSLPARLVFETRAKCQDFVARYKDDGIPYEVDSPFCNTSTNITVRQSKSLKDREIGRRFAPL